VLTGTGPGGEGPDVRSSGAEGTGTETRRAVRVSEVAIPGEATGRRPWIFGGTGIVVLTSRGADRRQGREDRRE
jgi:hypothetical protein